MDGDDGESAAPRTKRRKTTQLSLVQRESAGKAESRGSGTLRLATKHSNGPPRTSSLVSTLIGTAHATPVIGRTGDCRCRELLASFKAQFTIDERTAREKLRRASSDRQQSHYDYARLGGVVFDRQCLLSFRQIFQACTLTYVFDISCPTPYGLTGKPSNRTKIVKQQKLMDLVRAHRSPTGRRADKSGRLHGAAFYLDAKWTVM